MTSQAEPTVLYGKQRCCKKYASLTLKIYRYFYLAIVLIPFKQKLAVSDQMREFSHISFGDESF